MNVLWKRKMTQIVCMHAARHRQQGGDEIFDLHSSAKLTSVAGSIVQTAAKLSSSTLFIEAHACDSTTQNADPLDEMLECVRTTASIVEAALGGGLTLTDEDEGQDANSATHGHSVDKQRKAGARGEKEPLEASPYPVSFKDLTEPSFTSELKTSAALVEDGGESGGGLGGETEMMVGSRMEWRCLLPWPMPFQGNADASKEVAAAGSRACAHAGFDMRHIVFETLRGSPIPPIDDDELL